MTFKRTFHKLLFQPRRLFLVDAVGALLSVGFKVTMAPLVLTLAWFRVKMVPLALTQFVGYLVYCHEHGTNELLAKAEMPETM